MRRQVYIKRDSKTGIYKYRRDYPQDVKDVLGKGTFIRSLHTKILPEANAACSEAEREFDSVIENTRTKNLVPLAERQALVTYLQEYKLLPDDTDDIDLATVQKLISNLIKARDSSMNPVVWKLQDVECQFLKLPKKPNRVDVTKMLYQAKPFYKGNADIADRIMDIVERTYTPPATTTGSPSKVKLSHVYEQWKKGQQSHRQQSHVERAYKFLKEWCGDKPINAYTKQDIRELIEVLKELPKHLLKEIAALPLRKQVAIVKTKGITGELRAGQTVKSVHNAISMLFNTAINDLDVEMKNPAQGINIDVSIGKRERLHYNADDLNRIFHSPLYKGCKSNQKRDLAGQMVIRDAKFWLPLINLFTGARQEEIAQLSLADIQEQKGIIYLHINDWQDDKKVKNKNSIRIIPVHQELIKIGFKTYIDRLIQEEEQRLFPDLTRSPDGRYAKEFSKWYGRFCKKIGIEVITAKTQKNFHSYRHTFITAARRAKLPLDITVQLVGHGDGIGAASTVHRGYGIYEPHILNEYLQNIQYEELDLSHLYVSTSDNRPAPAAKPRVFRLPPKIRKT